MSYNCELNEGNANNLPYSQEPVSRQIPAPRRSAKGEVDKSISVSSSRRNDDKLAEDSEGASSVRRLGKSHTLYFEGSSRNIDLEGEKGKLQMNSVKYDSPSEGICKRFDFSAPPSTVDMRKVANEVKKRLNSRLIIDSKQMLERVSPKQSQSDANRDLLAVFEFAKELRRRRDVS